MARFIFLSLPFLLTACPEQTVKAFNAEPEAEIHVSCGRFRGVGRLYGDLSGGRE